MRRWLSTLVLPGIAVAFIGCSAAAPAATEDGARPLYTEEEIDYFLDVAFGSEFSNSFPRIRKWSRAVKVRVAGKPTDADRAMIQQVIDDLNALDGVVEVGLDARDSNVEIHFAPEREFSRIDPNYVPVNLGFFWAKWDRSGKIYQARILITTEGVTQKERSHLIREELTQILGLMRDSGRYPQSIFYQHWTDVTRYTDLDKTAIEILYCPEIRANMTESQARRVLNNLSG